MQAWAGEFFLEKNMKTQISIKIRKSTKDQIEKERAIYCGRSGKVISLTEYLNRVFFHEISLIGAESDELGLDSP